MDLVNLLQYLLEALAEREVAQNADCLLRPNFINHVYLRLFQLQPNRLRWLLGKRQARPKDMPSI